MGIKSVIVRLLDHNNYYVKSGQSRTVARRTLRRRQPLPHRGRRAKERCDIIGVENIYRYLFYVKNKEKEGIVSDFNADPVRPGGNTIKVLVPFHFFDII